MNKIDVIVFGASGFTGRLVVNTLFQICKKHPYSDIKWGIAGRSEEKLQDLLEEFKQSGADTSNIPIIIADVKDENTLKKMAEQGKVLMNCTGPYSTSGEPVVNTCLKTKTHYVDITAELHFMLKMYKKYHKAAEEANVLVIPACGYGSVPTTMGLVYLERNFQGKLQSVECYSELQIPRRLYLPGCNNTLVHYGTWASLVYEFQNFREYTEMKKEVFSEDIYDKEPGKVKRCFFHRHKGKYWFPYPGPDRDIVDMTQRYAHENHMKEPFDFAIYTTMPALFHLFIIIPAFMFYYYASYFGWFRKLLWKFPKFFTLGYMSHKGPSQKNRNDTRFSFTLTGNGVEEKQTSSEQKEINKTLAVKVSGVDPYMITAIGFVLSAITVLKESSVMPRGGVVTTAAAFQKTSLVDSLNENGLNFEIISQQ